MIRSVNRMGAKKLELGPTGETVRENIAYLREKVNLGFTEFSRQLESIGHSIPPLGLRRIENGERKVTVDDLAAIACILHCTPNYLMLPRADRDDSVETTGWGRMSADSLYFLFTDGYVSYADGAKQEALTIFLHNRPDWMLLDDPESAEKAGRAIISKLRDDKKPTTEEDNRQ